MKKIFTILTVMFLAITASADSNGIKLTFSGLSSSTSLNDLSTITVTPSALGSEDVSNVSASLVSITGNFPGFMSNNTVYTGSLIGPSNAGSSSADFWGGTSSANKTATLTFSITGLNNVISSFNKIGVGLEATNGSGAYQGAMNRSFTFSTAYSLDNSTFTNINSVTTSRFGQGEGKNGSTNSKNYNHYEFINNSDVATTSDVIYLQITITKTDANGCFWGLEDIEIELEQEQEVTYTLETVGAPSSGVSYTIDGNEISAGGTFTAYASDVTVSVSNTNTDYTVLSQTHTESGTTGTYTINFTYNGTVDLSTYTSGNYKATFSDPASSVEAGKWYLLCQDRGADGYAYDNGGTYYKGIASNFTTGTTLSTSNEVYLFHFVPTATAGVYYIQNADGTLFGAGTDKSNITASSVGYPYNVKVACTSNNITYYYMQSITNNLIVDNNGNGGTTSWWGTTVPTTTGNNTWRFYEVTFEEIPTEEAREALNTALTNANQYKDLIGTDLGKYNDPNADTDNAFLTVLSEAQTMYENNSSTAAQYEEETTKLTTATSALTLNMPSDLSFLRIKSSVTNGYLTSPIIGSTDIATTTTNQDASTIWFFHQGPSSGSTNPGYLLSYYSGEYINPSSGNMGYTIVTANTGTRIEDNSSHFLGTYNIHIPNGGWRYLSSGTTDGNISFGNMSGNPTILDNQTYAWKLEEVTSLPVKMNKAGDGKYYATVCVPVAVSVPTGTTAYAVTNVSGTYATLGNMNGVIPAGAGALLINEDDSEIKGDETNGYYIYLSVDGTAATYTGDNILYGASKAEAVTTTTDSGNTITTNYYFGQLNKTPGFYLGKGSYLSGKYITNRAYLTASAVGGSGSSKGFTFVFGDDDPTGISTATATDEIMENSVRYNLQGQRVDAGYKGIVIIGGKKYLIK